MNCSCHSLLGHFGVYRVIIFELIFIYEIIVSMIRFYVMTRLGMFMAKIHLKITLEIRHRVYVIDYPWSFTHESYDMMSYFVIQKVEFFDEFLIDILNDRRRREFEF